MSISSEETIRIEVDVAANIRKRLDRRRRPVWTLNRLIVVGVFLSLLLWATRYDWKMGDPMYGWPVCYQNLWYLGQPDQHSGPLFLLDAFLWLAISLSVMEVVRRFHEARRNGAPHVTLKGMLFAQGVVAVMFSLALAERACCENADRVENPYTTYGRIDFSPGYQLWIDGGLFTGSFSDRFRYWLPLRLAVIGFVACYVYCVFLAAERISLRIRSGLHRLRSGKKVDDETDSSAT